MLQRVDSATKLQAQARGRLARRRLPERRQRAKSRKLQRQNSATRLQANVRGMQARKRVQARKSGSGSSKRALYKNDGAPPEVDAHRGSTARDDEQTDDPELNRLRLRVRELKVTYRAHRENGDKGKLQMALLDYDLAVEGTCAKPEGKNNKLKKAVGERWGGEISVRTACRAEPCRARGWYRVAPPRRVARGECPPVDGCHPFSESSLIILLPLIFLPTHRCSTAHFFPSLSFFVCCCPSDLHAYEVRKRARERKAGKCEERCLLACLPCMLCFQCICCVSTGSTGEWSKKKKKEKLILGKLGALGNDLVQNGADRARKRMSSKYAVLADADDLPASAKTAEKKKKKTAKSRSINRPLPGRL